MTRKKGRQSSGIPPSEDPRWKAWSAPVFAFLSQPRTFHDQPKKRGFDHRGLYSWASEVELGNTKLVNCLAWLENAGLVYCGWVVPRVPFWAQAGVRGGSGLSPPPPPDEVEDGHAAEDAADAD